MKNLRNQANIHSNGKPKSCCDDCCCKQIAKIDEYKDQPRLKTQDERMRRYLLRQIMMEEDC